MSALVASLFAVGASPAHGDVIGAADSKAKASNTTMKMACLGPAVADQGFTDLGTLEAAVPNINCLAYYGISAGTSATTFDPNSNVTRRHMALFLYAAANLMGVDLMGGDMMADFGDIAELGEDMQNAIKALASNGILPGRGDMAFEPFADITRAEMAVALVALLDKTPGALVKKNKDGEYLLGADPGSRPNDHFADSRSSQPRHVDDAISAAYELGITSGVGDGSMFNPSGSVPRRNMATFIVNALNHSNVRPAGVTAQVAGTTITVSVRDADFKPVVNQPVDVFMADVAYESRAFRSNGTCTSRTMLVDGGVKCQIEGGDPVTQTDGNIEIAAIESVGDGKTVWIWIGDLGDKFGNDTDALEISVKKGAADPVDADSVAFSTDLPKQPGTTPPADVERVHYGTTITVTLQLKGETPAGATVNAGPPAGDPTKYKVFTEWIAGHDDDISDNTVLSSATQEVTVGSDGSATFTVSASDPDGNNRGNMTSVRYTVSPAEGSNAEAPSELPAGDERVVFVFSDESKKVGYISVSVPGTTTAPGSGTANTAAVIKVLDQFGKPFRGAQIRLFSSNETDPDTDDTVGATIGDRARVSTSSGTARFPYSYRGGASQETLVAMWDGHLPEIDSNGDGNLTDPGDRAEVGEDGFAEVDENGDYTCQEEDVCGDTKVNWVAATRAEVQETAVTVLSIDTDNDQIIVDLQTDAAITPTSINYDSTDNFQVTDTSDATTSPVSIGDFEESVTTALKNDAADTAGTVDAPTLTWSSYTHDDASDIALFTVTVP